MRGSGHNVTEWKCQYNRSHQESSSEESAEGVRCQRHQQFELPVIDRCFGKVRRTCFVDVYGQADSPCIECAGCRDMFSPRHFVLHSDDEWNGWSHGCATGNLTPITGNVTYSSRKRLQKSQPLLEELKRKFDGLTVVLPAGGMAAKRTNFGSVSRNSTLGRRNLKLNE